MNRKMVKEVKSRIEKVDEEYIKNLMSVDNGSVISNLLRNLENKAIVTILEDNIIYHKYLYKPRRSSVEGYVFQRSNINNKDSTSELLIFCRLLYNEFSEVHFSMVKTFNTFQNQYRGLLEKEGYFTFTNTEYDEIKSMKGVVVLPGGKNAVVIQYLDSHEFIKNGLGFSNHILKNSDNENKVYLMHNSENEYIKIGCSKNINYREGTLQSREPNIKLIMAWYATYQIEKELHGKFKAKRVRGEWFALSTNDLLEIKKFMSGCIKHI